jgi:hypothetical protein
VALDLHEWEANVLHSSISCLVNSPDKQARLSFAFYYFPDSLLSDTRPLFLSSDRFSSEYETIKRHNETLTSKNLLLQQELSSQSLKNTELCSNLATLRANETFN